MNNDPIVIVGMARTPQGNLLGSLKDVTAPQLGAAAIKAAIERAHISANDIQETLMGCVLPAGLGQAPARQAAIGAGIPTNAGATTINKMCGSGMKAIMLAHDNLKAGSNEIMVAGGMESMSNAPYLILKARSGLRLGHGALIDHMFLDGLEDAYEKGRLMGSFAENTANKYQFSRSMQDEFAISSLQRAQTASREGLFKQEIIPVDVKSRTGDILVVDDEHPQIAKAEKIPTLKPAFSPDGTITAANSSSISDGAAAVVLMPLSKATALGLTPLAKIIGHASFAQDPAWFTTAPASAIKNLFTKIGWSDKDVDLYEINEAFAVVTMATMHDLKLDHDKVNVNGGACALGHPIGASGARIVVTLISALQQRKLKRGVAALCIGGGEATALAVELM